MENGPKYTLIGSVVIFVIAVILMVFGSTVDVDVESEAVFKGTEGTVQLSGQTTYSVFVNENSDCYDTDIVITDGTFDYFEKDCAETMDEKGWKHAGVVSLDAIGTFDVTSSSEIIIVDDMVYLESGGSFLAGACICCLGIIGIIIGAVWASKSNQQAPAQVVIMPQQQVPMQVPVQVPLETAGYTPGELIITQQEEERDV
jgi:hypothetical protein